MDKGSIIGNIYLYLCKPAGEKYYRHYHLMALQSFEAVEYDSETVAYDCLILELGVYYQVYYDDLTCNGRLVA